MIGRNRSFKDYFIEVALGNVPGKSGVTKYGRATAGLQTTATDVWDRADATPTQQIWLAPTAARTHTIVSTSDEDSETGGVVAQGDGCRTLKIWGLVDWDTAESSETITMDGTTGVTTSSSYVIIHRMRALTWDALGPNAGTITATAASDSTVTAEMDIGIGSTLMAIYGIPSTQKLLIGRLYARILKSGGASASADMTLLENPIPDSITTAYITRDTFAAVKDGTSAPDPDYYVPKVINGPAIVKIQGIGSAADLDLSAGFDGVLSTI